MKSNIASAEGTKYSLRRKHSRLIPRCRLLLFFAILLGGSRLSIWGVTHDDADTIIPQFLVRLKAVKGKTANLTITFSSYSIFNNKTKKWVPYTQSVSLSTAAWAAWSVPRSIILRRGIPLDMVSTLKVTGSAVADYEIMINVPDSKYQPIVNSTRQRMITGNLPGAKTTVTNYVMFLHDGRTGAEAGKAEMFSTSTDNLRISLGHSMNGQPLGHLSLRKRSEPWIADLSYEAMLFKVPNSDHFQLVAPQMIFDITRNFQPKSGTFTVKCFDRETQPGTYVPVPDDTGYLDFGTLTPTISYGMNYSLAFSSDYKDTDQYFTVTRTEGITTMTSSARNHVHQTDSQGYWLTPGCSGGYSICLMYGCWTTPVVCPAPIFVETIPGSDTFTQDIRDWKSGTSPDRLLNQTSVYQASVYSGILNVTSTRSAKYDAFGQGLVTDYKENSTVSPITAGNGLFWRKMNINFDGSGGQFSGNVTYSNVPAYTAQKVGGGSHLKLVSRNLPGGRWEKFDYYDNFESYGMLKTLTVPFKDGPSTPDGGPAGALVTSYTYAENWDRSWTLPGTVITTLKGASADADQMIASTAYDYSASHAGQIGTIPSNIRADLLAQGFSSASLDAIAAGISDDATRSFAVVIKPNANNNCVGTVYLPRVWVSKKTEFANATDSGKVTITKSCRADDWPWLRDLPFSEELPDGQKNVYVYQSGSINRMSCQFIVDDFPGIDARNFRKAFRSIKINGFASGNPGDSPAWKYIEGSSSCRPNGSCTWYIDPIYLYLNRTTAEVRVTDEYGRLYSEETWALDQNGAFNVISKVVHKYDPAGNLIAKLRLIFDTTTNPGSWTYKAIYEAQYTGRNGDSLDYNSISLDNSGFTSTGRKQYERGEDGIIKKYHYDDYGRIAKCMQLAAPVIADLSQVPATQTVYEYDADNRQTAAVVGPVQNGISSASDALRSEKHYNLMGMITSAVVPGGRTTTFAYSSGGRTVTMTAKGLGDSTFDRTTIKEHYIDGRMKSMSGSAVVPAFYDYTVANGQLKESVYTGSSSGSTRMWTATSKDWLSRVIHVEHSNPAAVGNLHTYRVFDSHGHLVSSSVSGLAANLYRYDSTGQLISSGLDFNNNGTLDEVSSDRIAGQSTSILDLDGTWWEYTLNNVFPEDNSSAKMTKSETYKLTSGFTYTSVKVLSSSDTYMFEDSGSYEFDATGAAKITFHYILPAKSLAVKIIGSTLFELPEDFEISLNGKRVCTIESGGVYPGQIPQGIRKDFTYDAYGRLVAVKDRTGTTVYQYRSGTAEREYVRTPDGIWTQYHYDPAGRVDWSEQFDKKLQTFPGGSGRFTRFAYNLRGQLEKTWGEIAVPVRNVYYETADSIPELVGQLKDQISYNGGSGWTAASWPSSPGTENKTSYTYDPENGHVASEIRRKAEDNSSYTTAYTYNIRGRLATRTTQRGITTTYSYRTGSGELESVAYTPSGSGPGITYTYDRLGALATVTDGSGNRTIHYRAADHQLDYEDLPSATYGSGCRFTLPYDPDNRPSGHTFTTPAHPGSLSSIYAFDSTRGWLSTITTPLSSTPYNYSYTPNSHLVALITCSALPTSGASGFHVTEDPEPDMDHLRAITTSTDHDLARYEYAHNDRDEISGATRSGEMFQSFANLSETFSYNNRNELTGATSTASPLGTPTPLPDRALGFNYDTSGNRLYADRNSQRTTYSPNTLGQYASRNGPSSLPMSGLAIQGGNVTLQNTAYGSAGSASMILLAAASGPASYYYGNVSFGGSAGLFPLEVKTYRQSQLLNTQDKSQLAPSATETFQYDVDGNLTDDSLWHYTYDAEDRLAQVETLAALPSSVPRQRLIFTYDYLGRRVKKEIYSGNSSGTVWTLTDTRCFVYDDWNLIVEMKKTGSSAPVPVTYYAWGLDLSGSMQGAGGVGGFLGMLTGLDGASPIPYCAIQDGLGNLTGLMDAQSGKLAAEYEYSPFGDLIRSWGSLADQNPIRYSSKYFDVETGLVNFGFRYYSPSLGRFVNRDPQGEPGWANLLPDLSAAGGPSWGYIGQLIKVVHEHRYGGKDSSMAQSTESGSGYKNTTQTGAPLLDQKGNTSSIGGSGGSEESDPGISSAPRWTHPYGFLANDPLNDVEYLGLWGESFWGATLTGFFNKAQDVEFKVADSVFSLPFLNIFRAGIEFGMRRDLVTQNPLTRADASYRLYGAVQNTVFMTGLAMLTTAPAAALGRAAMANEFGAGASALASTSRLSPLSRVASTALRPVFEEINSLNLRTQQGRALTTITQIQRTFLTPTQTYPRVASSTCWTGQFLQRAAPQLQWQQSHIFLQRRWWSPGSMTAWYPNNMAASTGMRCLGNAGWNLMPLPARMNNYFNNHPWAAFSFGTGVAAGSAGFVGGSAYMGYRIGGRLFDE